jgi:hypothetical protein
MTTNISNHVPQQAQHLSGFIPTIHVDCGSEQFFFVTQTAKNTLKETHFKICQRYQKSEVTKEKKFRNIYLISSHVSQSVPYSEKRNDYKEENDME